MTGFQSYSCSSVAMLRRTRLLAGKAKGGRGAIHEREYDEQYGRGWLGKGEDGRPKLYTPIGELRRSPRRNKKLVRVQLAAFRGQPSE